MLRPYQHRLVDIVLKRVVMFPWDKHFVAGWEVDINGAEGIREVSKIFVCMRTFSPESMPHSLHCSLKFAKLILIWAGFKFKKSAVEIN